MSSSEPPAIVVKVTPKKFRRKMKRAMERRAAKEREREAEDSDDEEKADVILTSGEQTTELCIDFGFVFHRSQHLLRC